MITGVHCSGSEVRHHGGKACGLLSICWPGSSEWGGEHSWKWLGRRETFLGYGCSDLFLPNGSHLPVVHSVLNGSVWSALNRSQPASSNHCLSPTSELLHWDSCFPQETLKDIPDPGTMEEPQGNPQIGRRKEIHQMRLEKIYIKEAKGSSFSKKGEEATRVMLKVLPLASEAGNGNRMSKVWFPNTMKADAESEVEAMD